MPDHDDIGRDLEAQMRDLAAEIQAKEARAQRAGGVFALFLLASGFTLLTGLVATAATLDWGPFLIALPVSVGAISLGFLAALAVGVFSRR